jgi:hypothetical protein
VGPDRHRRGRRQPAHGRDDRPAEARLQRQRRGDQRQPDHADRRRAVRQAQRDDHRAERRPHPPHRHLRRRTPRRTSSSPAPSPATTRTTWPTAADHPRPRHRDAAGRPYGADRRAGRARHHAAGPRQVADGLDVREPEQRAADRVPGRVDRDRPVRAGGRRRPERRHQLQHRPDDAGQPVHRRQAAEGALARASAAPPRSGFTSGSSADARPPTT